MRLQKLLYNSVLPTARELTENPDHLVIILPTLLSLITNSTEDEYRTLLQPELRKVIAMTRPVQVPRIISLNFTQFYSLNTLSVDRTAARNMIGYWHDTVVCLSVCLCITLCIVSRSVGVTVSRIESCTIMFLVFTSSDTFAVGCIV